MQKKLPYFVFTVPSLLMMSCVMLFPLGYAIFNSFFSNSGDTFVGFGNYAAILTSPAFYHSLQVSVFFTVVVVLLEFVIGLFLAIQLDKIGLGRKFFSVTLYLPFIITAAAAGVIFRWMLMPEWGIVNQLLGALNIPAPNWFDNPNWAMVGIIAAEVWQSTPFVLIIMFSGLQSLPREQLEAGAIDGANARQLFWNVTLPHLRHLILFVFMMRTMDAWRLFDRIYTMTQGGPGDATETMVLYNFRISFRLLRSGEGLAVGVLTLLILCIPIVFYLRTMRSKEVD